MDRRRWRSITGTSDHRRRVGWQQVDYEVDEDGNAHNWNGLGLATVPLSEIFSGTHRRL